MLSAVREGFASVTLLEAGPLRFRRAARSAVGVAAVFYFFTGLDNYIGHAGGPDPLTFILAFIGIAFILLVSEADRGQPLLRSPILGWVACYFIMTTLWAVFMSGDRVVVQTLTDRYRSTALLTALLVIFAHCRVREMAIGAIAVVTVGISIMNLGELAGILSFSANPWRIPGRASGFFLNTNEAGIATVMGLALTVPLVARALRVPLLLVGLAGVISTFSRGAMVCLAVAVLWLAWHREVGIWSIAIVAISGVLVASYAASILESAHLLTVDTAARLALTQDDSGRLVVARKAWELFENSPLIGNGIGATMVWNEHGYAHNMYLTLAAEHGIVGALAFPALGVALVTSHRGSACFAWTMMAAGFFSHTLLEGTYAIVAIAVAAAPCLAVSGVAGDQCA